MKKTKYFENTDNIFLSSIGCGDAVLEIEGERFVMSYDATYELALKLASMLDSELGEEESIGLN